jgi:site-specific DNA recombinase
MTQRLNSPTSQQSAPAKAAAGKRAALYARVSTQEQTRGDYPSCESQVEELNAYCEAKAWHIIESVKDEGFSAGSLKRPGLTRLRYLVESEQIDVIVCTWYDRLTRSREFYILDAEFRKHEVDFVTLHDPADRNTASGRFMEMMLVGAKAYDREQTGEKVRIKMRMRAEKGLWNGGQAPFGFVLDPQTKSLAVNPEVKSTVEQMFRIYTETRSDFAVRDWLKARQIKAPGGKPVWSVGTLRDLLTNRRYIGEIEINKHNKGREELPEFEAYYTVKAPHEAVIDTELFAMAQAIRNEKAQEYPNNPGKVAKKMRALEESAAKAQAGVGNGNRSPRSYAWNQCGRVYPLQGLLYCAHCGSPMSPHYVHHKAGKQRRTASFIHHYVCAQYRKYGRECGHANRILARSAEGWMLDRVKDLVESEGAVEMALECARRNSAKDVGPAQEELARTRAALQATQTEIDTIVATITLGTASGAMVGFLNERANALKLQRDALRADHRRLTLELTPLEERFDSAGFRQALTAFNDLAQEAQPQELQRMLRLLTKKVEWGSDGTHRMHFHSLPEQVLAQQSLPLTKKSVSPPKAENTDWFDITMSRGCPGRTRTSDQSVNSRPLYH